MKTLLFLISVLVISISSKGQTTNRVDTLPSGEIMLVQEIVINQPIAKVWDALTTPEGWIPWATPVVEMDFRINGQIRTHYNPEAKIGDKGTIVLHISFYIPHRQIVMQAELNENFPEFMKGEEKNLYSVYDFEETGDQSTRLILYGIGYKNEKRWLELLEFFIKGNSMTLNQLKKHLEQDGQDDGPQK